MFHPAFLPVALKNLEDLLRTSSGSNNEFMRYALFVPAFVRLLDDAAGHRFLYSKAEGMYTLYQNVLDNHEDKKLLELYLKQWRGFATVAQNYRDRVDRKYTSKLITAARHCVILKEATRRTCGRNAHTSDETTNL